MDQGSCSGGNRGFHATTQEAGMHTDANTGILKLNETQDFLSNLRKGKWVGEDDKYERIRRCRGQPDRFKAESIPALKVQIGSWERIAQTENDVLAKFYFNQKKFVWEMLHFQRKFKIEITWFQISAFRAVFNEEASNLFVELKYPPAFFMEVDNVPRRHTTWQIVADFTNGEAKKHKWHILTFAKGVLERCYDKIIYSKGMLYLKSIAPFPSTESPFFDDAQNNYLSNHPNGNFTSHDQQQVLLVTPLDQTPQELSTQIDFIDNRNLHQASMITNVNSSVQASNFQTVYPNAEMNTSFDENIPLWLESKDQILPMGYQIQEQPISAHSAPCDQDQAFQPHERSFQVSIGGYSGLGVQNPLAASGAYNQNEYVHRLPTEQATSWHNEENILDDEDYPSFLNDHLQNQYGIFDLPVGDQNYPANFGPANNYGPNHQFPEPSVDTHGERNAYQGPT